VDAMGEMTEVTVRKSDGEATGLIPINLVKSKKLRIL
jgi:hypothetical protein